MGCQQVSAVHSIEDESSLIEAAIGSGIGSGIGGKPGGCMVGKLGSGTQTATANSIHPSDFLR
jgi:hypothetical protein